MSAVLAPAQSQVLIQGAVSGVESAVTNLTDADLADMGTALNFIIGTATERVHRCLSIGSHLRRRQRDSVEWMLFISIRLNTTLTDFIDFIQINIDSVPVVGPLIINPIITALKSEVVDLTDGFVDAVSGIISIFEGILAITNIVVPAGLYSPISNYLQNILKIPPGCGVQPAPCSSLIAIARMLADAVINLVSQIPPAGAAASAVLPGLIKGMFDAASLGSITAI
ncbi:hypothetical protein BGZ80_001172 [Entomortierella chlamydospora]|uniref:Uncharacterized protein n=1 Tax=Entomortierella chlamydospora TaxID=101097 RepID=A0A9P6MSD9_9FUNG|nr:hypothetical protein BGZ80_001172 [Entomortierella chlamydospora]